MDKQNKFVSVVAYMYNQESQAAHFIDVVMGHCQQLFDKCEFILVDDASTDNSLTIARSYLASHSNDYMSSIVRLSARHGLEPAMNAGRDVAIGDFVFEFDDMFVDYDVSVIDQAFEKCLAGNDVVAVSSDAKIKLTSRMFYRIYNRFSGTGDRIGSESFRLLSRRAVNRVKDMGTYIPYRKAVYMNSGLKTIRITYQSLEKDRTGIHSIKSHRSELAVDSLIYFTNAMEKVSLAISTAFFVLAIIVVIYIIQSLLMDEHLSSGWVSVMGFLSVGFVGLFLLLTIILRYLSVLVNLVFRHQRYLIEDIEKISGR